MWVTCSDVARSWIRKRGADVVYGLYERRLSSQVKGLPRPRHVGVMLDGNRRWAREAGFADVADGHRVGARRIHNLLEWCADSGVEVVTLWLLSTDNVNRPESELVPLLEIIGDVVDELAEPDLPWRLKILGALDVLPKETADRLTAAAARTKGH